jgi:hypothetical protein
MVLEELWLGLVIPTLDNPTIALMTIAIPIVFIAIVTMIDIIFITFLTVGRVAISVELCPFTDIGAMLALCEVIVIHAVITDI